MGSIRRNSGTNGSLTFAEAYGALPRQASRDAMNRRRLLAATGVALASPLSGCLNRSSGGTGGRNDGPVTPVGRTPSTPDEDGCGSAGPPLSARLTDNTGDPDFCFDGARPSLAVENERAERLTVTLQLDAEDEDGEVDGDGFAETYVLDPGARAVEPAGFEARPGIGGTVHVEDDGAWTVEWPERSCYRYGVALGPNGVEIGWVEPLKGRGDTQHDCYPGTEVPLEIQASGAERTVDVTIHDRCTGATFEDRVQIAADRRERIEDELVSGGVYDVALDVEDGGSGTYEFHDGCWGVVAGIGEDGEVELRQRAID